MAWNGLFIELIIIFSNIWTVNGQQMLSFQWYDQLAEANKQQQRNSVNNLQQMPFQHYNRQQKTMLLIILPLLLLSLVSADCPINPYPRKTFTGIIEAKLNNDPLMHGTPQEYTDVLEDGLLEGGTTVAVGVLGIEVNSHGIVDFQVVYVPETNLRILKFRVIVIDSSYGWRTMRFNYIGTQSPLLFISTESVANFSGYALGKFSTYRPLVSTMPFDADAVVRVFLGGMKVKAKALGSDYTLASTQYDNFRRTSANPQLITYFSQAVEDIKSLSFQITSTKLINKNIAISFETNCDVTLLRFSYMVFNPRTFNEKNSFITSVFQLVNDEQYKFTPLQNMEMRFLGLTKFQVSRDQSISLTLRFNNFLGQASFDALNTLPFLAVGYSFVAFELKLQYICEDCPNSPIIYENKFCVQQCPRGYSQTKRLLNTYCDICSMDKLKVIDPITSGCVCANRHYLDSALDTCKPCRYDCMTCSSSTQCLTCDNSLMQTKRRLTAGEKCECPAVGFYDDKAAENIVCQKCSPKCLTCNGPRDFDCLTCSPTKQLDSKGFCVCKNGFVEDISGNCTCIPPLILNGTLCLDIITQCGPDQIEQFVDLTRRCVCRAGYHAVLKTCVLCGNNAVFDNDNLVCKCVGNTVKINETDCGACQGNTVFDSFTSTCVCRPGTFKANDGSCVTCPAKMAYLNGKCQCIFNFFEIRPNVCQRCLRETDGPKCYRNPG